MQVKSLICFAVFYLCLLNGCSGNLFNFWKSPPKNLCGNKTEGIFVNNSKINFRCRCDDKSVDCSSKRLEQLPKQIYFSKGIHLASFKDNAIKEIKEDVFYSAKDIIELDFSHNEIDFISIRCFQAFPNLRRLILNYNELWNLPEYIFDGLQKLTTLDLSNNKIKNLFPHIFEYTRELNELNLENNPLHELESNLFEHLGQLTALNLKSTVLQNISDFTFSYTPDLKSLILANNQFRHIPSTALKNLKKLYLLDLTGNPIRVIESEAFLGLDSLTRLHLNQMPLLTKIKQYAFSHLLKLRELQCSDNFDLSYIEEGAFNSMDQKRLNLRKITLRQNNLGTIHSDVFQWGSSLELHVTGNPLICDCKLNSLFHINFKNDVKSQIKCKGPSKLENRLLSSLKESDLLCESISVSETVYIASLVALALLIVVSIAGCFAYKKKLIREDAAQFKIFKKTDTDDVIYERGFRSDIL